MASEKDTSIYILGQVKKIKAKTFEKLTPEDFKIISQGLKIFLSHAIKPITSFNLDPRFSQEKNLQEQIRLFHSELIPLNVIDEIINYFSKAPEAEHKRKEEPKEEEKKTGEEKEVEEEVAKPKNPEEVKVSEKAAPPTKEESSVPPEIEGLVEEYRQNQARLNEEEVKSSSQRTVAEQVKIALAHSNIREQIMANRREREEAGEKFRDIDKTIVNLGDPKSQSIEAVLSTSKKAVDSVAYTYPSFSSLPISLQRQIINQAVDLNLAGVKDLDIAIQTVSLQLGVKDISSSFVSEVAEEINDIEQEIIEIDDKLSQNEATIDNLQTKTTLSPSEEKQLSDLLRENADLVSSLNRTSTRFYTFVDSQTEEFEKYSKDKERRQPDERDISDFTDAANQKVSSIHETFLRNGVKSRSFSDLDKMSGLVAVLQKDIPGIHQYASYEGAQAAVIIGGGQGQAILAYSKGVTGSVLRQAEKYAAINPNSATAKFLKNNARVFGAARRSIREIENSKLGKDILQSVSKGRQIIGIVSNPVGALKQWAGKKAGEQFRKRITEKIGNVVLKNAANTLLKEGFKSGIKKLASEALTKMAVKVATWAAVKLGISLAAESLNAIIPGLGVIVDITIQVLVWVAEQTIGLAKKGLDNVWRELGWGDKFRSRDLILPVVAGGAVAATAGVTFVKSLIAIRRSIQIATVSAIGIIIGALVTMGAYIAIAYLIAPVLSTLVQFDSLSKVDYSEVGGGGPGGGPGPGGGGGVYNLDCGEEAGAEIMIQAGQYPVVKKLLTGPGRTGYCITPTKITIHWSGAWTNNDHTYDVLITRGLSCQLGTDQDGSVQQWQQMWEKKAELAYCTGGNENNYCLNNEMVGAYFIPPGTSPSTPDEKSPSEDEIQSAVNSTCFMMKQYNLPYTQIFGHYQLRPGKIDPGVEFLEYFINRVKQECPSKYP